MDEAGLATAIHGELGANMADVYAVFDELNQNRNSDADDVANAYLNIVRSRKGSIETAIKSDTRLKNLLIKILDEGYTSAEEQKNIDFLKGK